MEIDQSTRKKIMAMFPNLMLLDNDNDMITRTWLMRAYEYAKRDSTDPNTHVGTVLYLPNAKLSETFYAANVILGIEENPDRAHRPTKYRFSSHAESRAIMAAVRENESLKDGVMYAPWFCCSGCAKIIGESGIKQVVGHMPMFALSLTTEKDWLEDMMAGHLILTEQYAVECCVYDAKPLGVTCRVRDKIHSV